MTTPAPQPERMTAEELRQRFADMQTALDALTSSLMFIRTDLDALRDGISRAASQRPTPASEKTTMFTADTLVHDIARGKHAYFLQGGQYAKHGVRVWPEVLPLLGLEQYENGEAGIYQITPVQVVASLEEYEKDGETKIGPRKVIGKA